MESLPFIIDAEDAAEYLSDNKTCTDAVKAYAIGIMAKAGKTNSEIRVAAGIEKNYQASHFIRVGKVLSEEELTMWHRNPRRITLGHVRAVAKCKAHERLKLLEDLLTKKVAVQTYEKIARGEKQSEDVDIKRFEQDVSESIGRPISIKYNPNKKKGEVVLAFFGLDDLDIIVKALGHSREDEW